MTASACADCGTVTGIQAPRVLGGDELRVGKRGAAIFSRDGSRRRWLYRSLSGEMKRVGFVMLNPSSAGADDNDRTITRCEGFAHREGAGSMEVANLSDWIETDSANLGIPAARGLMTDSSSRHYLKHVMGCDLVIAAWGAHPWARGKLALWWLQENGGELPRGFVSCLGRTKTGAPNHPLYLPANKPLELWP